MAGEVQDHSSLQADILPTGSISFGRFELESLSWQRRSSFSYNKYLEDVEKYSTPGLVTQKKAYFEDQYKKRALWRQASSDHQNGVEFESNRKGLLQHMDFIEEHIGVTAGREQHAALSDYYERESTERNGGQFQHDWYTETMAVSDRNQYSLMQHEQNAGTPPNACPVKAKTSIDEKVLESSGILIEHNETTQTQSRYDVVESNKHSPCIGVEHKLENDAGTMNRLLGKRDPSCKSPINEKDNAPSLKKTQRDSLKVKTTVEQKPAKLNVRTPAPVPKSTKKTSGEKQILFSGKPSSSTFRTVEKENTLPRKTEKLSTRVPSSTFSRSNNLKSSDLGKQKAQVRKENGSEKGHSARKGSIISPPVTERSRKVVSSVKGDAKQSDSTHRRADKRKEELKEMEGGHLRRGLNFKTASMPVPREIDGKKTVASQSKSLKLQSNNTVPASGVTHCEHAPELAKRGNGVGFSSQLTSSSPVNGPIAAGGHTSSLILSNGRSKTRGHKDNPASHSRKKIEAGKRELRSKPTMQQRQKEGGVKTGERVVAVPKAGEMGGAVRRSGAQKVIGSAGRNIQVGIAS